MTQTDTQVKEKNKIKRAEGKIKKIRIARKIFDFELLFMLGRKNFNIAHKVFRFQLLLILGTKNLKFTRKIFKVESLLRLEIKKLKFFHLPVTFWIFNCC